MAYNDMYVVMYQIIAYLYDCMKRGELPQDCMYSAEALGISQRYWDSIMVELVNHKFVSGVVVFGNEFSGRRLNLSQPTVTMEGVAFAQENSMMGRAKSFLMDAKASIPFI